MNLSKYINILCQITFLFIIFISVNDIIASENQHYVKINKVFLKDSHWHFKLKDIEKKNNIIKISIRYLNKGSYRRPIFLSQGNSQAITRKNEDGSITTSPVPNQDTPLAILTNKEKTLKYNAFKVEGITTNSFTNVEPRKGKNAIFYFEIDKKLEEAYFSSEWVTVIMRGAASVIPLKIFLKIP